MKNDKNENKHDYDILKSSSEILSKHGKSDKEIRAFLEEQFPISSAIIDKILESRKKK